ncbi:hypothetical protein LENED_000085 [Lentinula edodes]|uniref:Uncharacterized protein n=1 Tax=Lentinula edodes TaxID=5353 RepID=A0A1Q3DUP8_LENED|nr:hypothetical protein LENED_000085 [Lentinula edodes]
MGLGNRSLLGCFLDLSEELLPREASRVRTAFEPIFIRVLMVLRLPSQLESFVPPPASQALNAADAVYTPWRGQFLVSGTRASDIGSNVNIRVTGVETDGETPHRQSHLWPSRSALCHDFFGMANSLRLWLSL